MYSIGRERWIIIEIEGLVVSCQPKRVCFGERPSEQKNKNFLERESFGSSMFALHYSQC